MDPSSALAPPSPSGRRLGRYEILHRLGEGGMGQVFEGRHVDLGKRVAVKVLQPTFGENEAAERRILREGRAATAIRHPNVVTILDVGIEHSIPYLVMDLLEGEDLSQLLQREGPLTIDVIIAHLLPVISGIVAVHAAGIVHRDLKPSNIFLARRHRGIEPVVVDFGISKFVGPSVQASATGSQGPVGTLRYMAPEQVRASHEVTAKTDQYALGVILYECATGGTPFWGDNAYELLHAIMTAPVVPPSELNPQLVPAFDTVVLRALARDPAERFPDVAALAAALLPFANAETRAHWQSELGGESALHAFALSASHSAIVRDRRSSKWRRVAAAAAGVVAVSAAAIVLVRPPTPLPSAPSFRPLEMPSSTPESPALDLPSPATAPSALDRSSVPPPTAVAPVPSAPAQTANAKPAPPLAPVVKSAPRAQGKTAPKRASSEPTPVLRGANDVPILEVE